jgi:hypothetical protein
MCSSTYLDDNPLLKHSGTKNSTSIWSLIRSPDNALCRPRRSTITATALTHPSLGDDEVCTTLFPSHVQTPKNARPGIAGSLRAQLSTKAHKPSRRAIYYVPEAGIMVVGLERLRCF